MIDNCARPYIGHPPPALSTETRVFYTRAYTFGVIVWFLKQKNLISLMPSTHIFSVRNLIQPSCLSDQIYHVLPGNLRIDNMKTNVLVYCFIAVAMLHSLIIPTYLFAAQPPPDIDVWYGSTQYFGHLGNPQQWINILGRVTDSDGVNSLNYTLNGGASTSLPIGPNGTRLVGTGDFNAEIDKTMFLDGTNALILIASDSSGLAATTSVTVIYAAGNIWPSPFTSDWTTVSSISEAGQVVDGLWELVSNGVHTLQTGYDRLITIGDETWPSAYEVTAHVTIHSASGSSGIGFATGWQGHTGSGNPRTGWPLQAIGWIRNFPDSPSLRILTYTDGILAQQSRPEITADTEYILKTRSEPLGGSTSRFYVKLWDAADPEPAGWDINADVTTRAGSVLLITHHADITWGTITIVPLDTNLPPMFTSSPVTAVTAGQLYTYAITADDPDTSDTLTITAPTHPDWLSFTDYADGSALLTGTPSFTEIGLAPVSLHLQDSFGHTNTQSFSINVMNTGQCAIISDDFYPETTAQAFWRFFDPLGDCTQIMDGTNAKIDIPSGQSHDLWTGSGNRAPRLLQSAPNADFGIQVKFDSIPVEQYQMQGLIVQQTDNTFLRFGTYHSGTSPMLFCAFIDGGANTTFLNTAPTPAVIPRYLKVARTNNNWTYSYSSDSTNWKTAVAFSQGINVTEVGFYAGNHTPNPAFTGNADYFMNLACPIHDTDNSAPVFASVPGTSATIGTQYSYAITATDSDSNDVLTITAPVLPGWLTLTDYGDGTALLSGTPGLSDAGQHAVKLMVVDLAGSSDTQSFSIMVSTPGPVGKLISDDFDPETTAQSFWRFFDPLGDCTLTMSGTHAEIGVPAGQSHNLWNTGNYAPRLLQLAPDTDFAIEVKFDSIPVARYQMQGIIIQQTNNIFLRFGMFHDGSTPRIFAAYVTATSATAKLNVIPTPAVIPPYVRVARTNDTWTYSYSYDRVTWTVAVSFSQVIEVTEAGIYGGNHDPNPAYTARADYFMNLGCPIFMNVVSLQSPSGYLSTFINQTHQFYTQSDATGGVLRTGYGPRPDGIGWTWHTTGMTNAPSGQAGTNSFRFPRPGKYYYGAQWLYGNIAWHGWNQQGQTNAYAMNAEYYAEVLSRASNVLTRWTFDTPGNTSPSTGAGTFSWTGNLATNWPGDGTLALDGFTLSDTNRHLTFSVSTAPQYVGIGFNVICMRSATGPETLLIQYSIDGSTFFDFDMISLPESGTWYTNQCDMVDIILLSQNPNAAFRIIGTNAVGSVLYLDDVSVSYAFPEPTCIITIGMYLLIMLRRKANS